MTYYKVDPNQMQAASEQMKAISLQIDTILDTLRAKLNHMTWKGADQASYAVHKQNWDNAVTDLNNLLNEIGAAVGIAKENYVTTELNNAKLW
jgi:6 kDa early secretory antigenic target